MVTATPIFFFHGFSCPDFQVELLDPNVAHSEQQRGRWIHGTVKAMGTRPGKHTKSYGKSPFLMGKLTISMVIFNSYVKLP